MANLEETSQLTFKRSNSNDRAIVPLAPKRFDITFNTQCMPDPNTICFVAKLKTDTSVSAEQATKANLQNALHRIIPQAVMVSAVPPSFSSKLLSIDGLTLAERDSIQSRSMNPVSFVSRASVTAFSFNTTCVYMGQNLGIRFAGILFGIVEDFAQIVSKARGDNWVSFDLSTAPFIRSKLESSLVFSPELLYYSPSVHNVTVESNETIIHVKFAPDFLPHPIDFLFSVYTAKESVSVMFESANLAELYKNCFYSKGDC